MCMASRDHVLVMFLYLEPSAPSVCKYLANGLVDRSLDEKMGGGA